MKISMVIIRLLALRRKHYQNNALICFAAFPDNISLILKAVHIGRKRTDGHAKALCDFRHPSWLFNTDSLNNMHVIVCDILKFLCDNRLRLCIHDIVEKDYQHLI